MQPYVCEECGVIRDKCATEKEVRVPYGKKGKTRAAMENKCPVCGSIEGRYIALDLHYEERRFDRYD